MKTPGNASDVFFWTVQSSDTVGRLTTVAVYLHRVLLPGIALFGLIGNLLSLLVFTTTRLRRLSSSLYLSALSLCDSAFLLCVLVLWVDTLNVPLFHHPGVCQTIVYLTFVFSFLSVWIVNVLTLEMYVITFHLSTRTLQLLDRSVAVRVLICLTGFALAFYTYNAWTIEIHDLDNGKKLCTESSAYFVLVLSCVDTLMTSLLPMVMMLVMTTRLLLAITKDIKRESLIQLQTKVNGKPSFDKTTDWTKNENTVYESAHEWKQTTILSELSLSGRRMGRGKNQSLCAYRKLRRMLIAVSVVFLILNLPQHINKVQSQLRSLLDDGYELSDVDQAVTHMLDLLFYSNFSVNFLVYSGFTKQFRNHIFAIPVFSICEMKFLRKCRKDGSPRQRKLLQMSSAATGK